MNIKIIIIFWINLFLATIMVSTSFASSVNKSSYENISYRSPINIIFDVHIEPMGTGPNYFQRRTEVNWLRETAIKYGVKLSLQSNGEYMEYCIENNHQSDFLKYINAGFDVGTHSHLVSHINTHQWVSHYNDELTFELVDKIISDAEFFVDAVVGPENNIGLCTQTNSQYLDEMMDKHDFMFITGPGEEGYFSFGHMVWNPFRPSTDEDYPMKENLDTNFITIPHLPQIGKPNSHNMNLLLPQMKRRFIMIYLEWLNHERNNDDDKVWVWGWCTHPCQNLNHRQDIEEMLRWLNENFIGKKSADGNTIAAYSTASEIYQQYLDWENENPSVSMFSYIPGNPYPYTYEALPEILDEADYDSKINYGENLNIHKMIKNNTPMYIIWTDSGEETIDFRDELFGKLKCTDGHGNVKYCLSKELTVSEEPLVVEFYSKYRNLQPNIGLLNKISTSSVFNIFLKIFNQ